MLIDIHLHTGRYSPCSHIPADRLIAQAVRAGLDGIVITEHHYQWSEEELRELRDASESPHFLVLAGFEYSSNCGDLLIYGLAPSHVKLFVPGGPPEKVALMARRMGGVCVAAHPTRAGLGFDQRVYTLPLAALEVCSTNLTVPERKLALGMAQTTGLPAIAASDAHRLPEVGRYCTEFTVPIQSMADLQSALLHGRFRLTEELNIGTDTA